MVLSHEKSVSVTGIVSGSGPVKSATAILICSFWFWADASLEKQRRSMGMKQKNIPLGIMLLNILLFLSNPSIHSNAI